ncbi:MAG TPA: HGGxSTG domain-containing protein [Candidatus Dormibacteraeota bacterium]
MRSALSRMSRAPRCGARTRSGRPCRSPAMRGKARCRMHSVAAAGARAAGRGPRAGREGLAKAAAGVHRGIRSCLYARRERSRDRELARMTVELTLRVRTP